MTECVYPSNHDWVVTDMYGERDLRAFYHIQCANCGLRKNGNADEIPRARFASADEIEEISK